jgi:TolB-like protein
MTCLPRAPLAALAIAALVVPGCVQYVDPRYDAPMSATEQRLGLEGSLDRLAEQIMATLASSGSKSVAIVQFLDVDGRDSHFGRYLSEELTTRVFMTRRFKVIERSLLDQVLAEQQLQVGTNLVDPASAKRLGKILGVDAILSGTWTDLSTHVKVNARLIGTETGEVLAVAAENVDRGPAVRKLIGQRAAAPQPPPSTMTVPRSPTTPAMTPSPTAPASPPPAIRRVPSTRRGSRAATPMPRGYVFWEDFETANEGGMPRGWQATGAVGVLDQGRERGLSIKTGRRQRLATTLPAIAWPRNFVIEIDASEQGACSGGFELDLGAGLTLANTRCQCRLGQGAREVDCALGQGGKVELVKRGDRFIYRLNGKDVVERRFSGFVPGPRPILFVEGSDESFVLSRIAVRRLPGGRRG